MTELCLSFQVWVRREDYTRPKRLCPYCKLDQTRLRRHLSSKHAQEPEVAAALQLPLDQQQTAFDLIKKDGIFQENRASMKADCPLKRDHQPPVGSTTVTRMCGQCKGFFSESYMWRHKLICAKKSNLTAESLPIPTVATSMLNTNVNGMEGTEFAKEVLPGLLHDEVGRICRSDPTILVFGKHEWDKNVKEDKKPVRNAMRQLGHLVLECRKISKPDFTGADLFDRLNFDILTKALDLLTTGAEGEEKSSSKLGIVNTIKSASKTVKATYLINDQVEKATEMDRFRVVLDINWAAMVNRATYHLQMRDQELLRQPKQLPLKEDVKKIADYIKDQLPSLEEKEHMTVFEFNRMRAMLVTRMTLFNGRRGGECAKMSLADWDKTERKVWGNQSVKMFPHEEALINEFELAYLAGKGRKVVPVLIPNNCVPAIRKMVTLRDQMAINPSNPYLFPAGRHSKLHVPGNHAIAEVCGLAETSRPVTATEVRHSISTYYACQDLPAQERARFYEHMGHSENINKNVYQAPLVFQEVTMVGKHLLEYDAQVGDHSEARRGNHDQARMAVDRSTVSRGTTNGADAEGSDRPVCGQYYYFLHSLIKTL
jgi:integrase